MCSQNQYLAHQAVRLQIDEFLIYPYLEGSIEPKSPESVGSKSNQENIVVLPENILSMIRNITHLP
jgi:hypothetical protein